MGESNDYTSETLQEESAGSGTAGTEVAARESGTDEPTADFGESDGRGSGVARGNPDGDSTIDNGQNGDSAGLDGNVEGDSQSTTTSGDTAKSQSGQLQAEGVGNTQKAVSGDESEVFQGVTASQFDDAMQQLHGEVSALNASCLILVAAIFACFGALCVQTLVRSFTWEK